MLGKEWVSSIWGLGKKSRASGACSTDKKKKGVLLKEENWDF